ncbi:MAG: hypothetical protein DLM67_08895 [Candidatus Nephthysia bennettiae]|uniref:DUF2236 domain-containing protein n=1 Tax=Candidatus Nephthysia bennettiae TaxID=3127016 RepID=A0A934K928_9BACT|nr:hypothetical protein [Candidatus Dormibacteraeota bacterium]MBJ7613662.1 hypothetical protein [Candidatus Dormibacteraeota bacterium]PZR97041.1 MAG: hypothetical protein DLM67_08895 [Candidatus Dormibacteraeota bacterium]
MHSRLFSEQKLTRLRGFPAEASPDEVILYFTLTEPDIAFVARAPEPRAMLAAQGGVVADQLALAVATVM